MLAWLMNMGFAAGGDAVIEPLRETSLIYIPVYRRLHG